MAEMGPGFQKVFTNDLTFGLRYHEEKRLHLAISWERFYL